MSDEYSVISSTIKSNLSDKSSDKRKQAALDIGQAVYTLIRGGTPPIAVITLLEQGLRVDEQVYIVTLLIQCLANDFCRSAFANRRKGGLIGLSSIAISLEQERVQIYVQELVPPVLTCFSDEDSGVRYNACEAFYNIVKVARQGILAHFNAVFDGLCQLYADVEQSVKDGAQCLDRLVRDIVTESRDFDYAAFIPLLTTRIRVLNPFVRELVLGWIVLLDSVPEVDMIAYLPQYLEGLFGILASDHRKVKYDADACLGELLLEIKSSPPARAQRAIADAAPTVARCCRSAERRTEDNYVRLTALGWLLEFVRLQEECDAIMAGEMEPISPNPEAFSSKGGTSVRWVTGGLQLHPNAGLMAPMLSPTSSRIGESRRGSTVRHENEQSRRGYSHQRTLSGGSTSGAERGDKDVVRVRLGREVPTGWAAAQTPVASTASIRSGGLQRLAPVLLEGALHCLDDGEGEIRQHAEQANKAIFDAVQRLCADAQPVEAVMQAVISAMKGVAGSQERSEAVLLACFRWARLLLERCPSRMLRPDVWDSLFEASVEALRRKEDEVVGTALQLISLLVRTRDDLMCSMGEAALLEDSTLEEPQDVRPGSGTAREDFFAGMSQRLFKLLSEDSAILSSRGVLVVRTLCAGVGAERFFATAARAMVGEQDSSFARRLIRVLNRVLLTSRETRDLRKCLLAAAMSSPRPGVEPPPSSGSRRDVPLLALDLLKAWFHCPVSTLLLCLWLHWFELASETAMRIACLEFNEELQNQLREFIDLLDSPVFMRVRLAMLDTKRHPALLQTMLALVALLPRERGMDGPREPVPAEMLRNRLNIVETGLLLEKVRPCAHDAAPREVVFPDLLECFDKTADIHNFRTPVM